ncbi:unnamed protein product [Rotaria sordida]|uniref:S-phase kinase-associated protein 1 n=1 Tax=Rotaria sordida TaxID=392033 RepID=A0A818LA02_9BILA|nr:unnamed protein product [Rotaria sordida]CAF0900971.1 unnamed protein product [Rotaria sordida]CAF3568998.1 unnamed protein product [Rotaria sordida]CAF3840869.1 unnamed protein product [Rotaria sordida]
MSEEKIKVQTSDGDIIEVDLFVAKQWEPVKNIYEVLDSKDAQENPIELTNVGTEALNKIIEWSIYHKQDKLTSEENQQNSRRYIEIPQWDQEFFKIKQEMIFEIIMAANYLGMTVLLDMACKTIADIIKGKTPEEVRQTFNIPNDLPPLKTLEQTSND